MSSYRNLLLLILSLSYVPLFTACDPTPEELWREGRDYERSADFSHDEEERSEYYRKAYECYLRAAVQDCSKAYYDLGCCYYYGNGVSTDYDSAFKWFREAVEDWSLSDEEKVDAQILLGHCYKLGRGVSKDYVEAAKLYRLAAEQGSGKAQFYLGLCYFYGVGVVENKEKAVMLFHRATVNGFEPAYSKLGECYLFGYGVPKDIQKAIEFWQKVVDYDTESQYYLGLCYIGGQGVPKDVDKAVELLHQAAKSGHEKAAQALDDLLNNRMNIP